MKSATDFYVFRDGKRAEKIVLAPSAGNCASVSRETGIDEDKVTDFE